MVLCAIVSCALLAQAPGSEAAPAAVPADAPAVPGWAVQARTRVAGFYGYTAFAFSLDGRATYRFAGIGVDLFAGVARADFVYASFGSAAPRPYPLQLLGETGATARLPHLALSGSIIGGVAPAFCLAADPPCAQAGWIGAAGEVRLGAFDGVHLRVRTDLLMRHPDDWTWQGAVAEAHVPVTGTVRLLVHADLNPVLSFLGAGVRYAAPGWMADVVLGAGAMMGPMNGVGGLLSIAVRTR